MFLAGLLSVLFVHVKILIKVSMFCYKILLNTQPDKKEMTNKI